MPHEWNIRPRGNACEACQRPFAEGETCVSSIVSSLGEDGEPVIVRSDRCAACAQAAPVPDAISVWQSPYHAPEPPAKTDLAPRQTVETLLRRLFDEADPARAPALYILAVMLERKKILIERDVRPQPDGSLLRLYEHRRTGEAFLIPDPGLRPDQLDQVQEEIVHLLDSQP